MSRAVGQVDPRKSEAILDAATELFGEKGAAATMDEIARRAGVSKQTLYNRYNSKLDVARALAVRRSDAITAPLRSEGDPETVLTAYASALLTKIVHGEAGASLRGLAMVAPEAPDIAAAIYDGGPGQSLRRLSTWLTEQDRRGLLRVPDPVHAAEIFSGMALGHSHLRSLLDVDHPDGDRIPERARETARRFIRAFAPD